MSDWPNLIIPPTYIPVFSDYTSTRSMRGLNASSTTASRTWVANQAVYVPMWLPFQFTVNRFLWCNGSATGNNVDLGIFNIDRNKITSTGSTAGSGTSNIQWANASPAATLTPGMYYFGYSNNGTTNNSFGVASITAPIGRLMGCFEQASAFPLPNLATFSQWAATVAQIPIMGITSTTTGI